MELPEAKYINGNYLTIRCDFGTHFAFPLSESLDSALQHKGAAMDLIQWERPAPKDLWDAFEDFRGEMGRTLDLFNEPSVAGLLDRTTAPAVDVIETDDAYIVIADIPGVDRKNIDVTVSGSLLSIKGSKGADSASERRRFFRKETWAGSFNRTIDLMADIDAAGVEGELKDGILTIRVPKREEAKTKSVAIKVD